MCDELYLTLVSNNKTDDNNTIASFTTNLPRKFEFENDWVVGLSEITFTKSWFNVRENALITVIDDLHNEYGSYSYVRPGYYSSEQELVDSIMQAVKKIDPIVDSVSMPSVSIDKTSRRVLVEPGKMKNGARLHLWFSSDLPEMLGLKFYYPNEIKAGYESCRAYDLNAGIYSIFVYCDLIEPTFVGDSFAQVIRTVSIPSVPFSHECSVKYNPIQYHTLSKKVFEKVEIQLIDDTGDLIPFEFGRSKIILHLKKNV